MTDGYRVTITKQITVETVQNQATFRNIPRPHFLTTAIYNRQFPSRVIVFNGFSQVKLM